MTVAGAQKVASEQPVFGDMSALPELDRAAELLKQANKLKRKLRLTCAICDGEGLARTRRGGLIGPCLICKGEGEFRVADSDIEPLDEEQVRRYLKEIGVGDEQ